MGDARIDAAAKAIWKNQHLSWDGEDWERRRSIFIEEASVALAAADAVEPRTVLSTVCASCGGVSASECEKLKAALREIADNRCGNAMRLVVQSGCGSSGIAARALVGSVPPTESTKEPAQRVECQLCDAVALLDASDGFITDFTPLDGWEFTSETGWLCPKDARASVPLPEDK